MEPEAPGTSGSSPCGPPATCGPSSSAPPPAAPHASTPPAQPPEHSPRAPAPAEPDPPSAVLDPPSAAGGLPSAALAPSQSLPEPVASGTPSAGSSPTAPAGGLEDAAGLLGLFAASKPAARPQTSASYRSTSASLAQDSDRPPQPLFRFRPDSRPDSNQQPAGSHSATQPVRVDTQSTLRSPTESSKQPAFRPQSNGAKPPAASEPQDPAAETMVVFDCRHPGCGKTFHSSDAVRKHARKQHPFWLRRIDEVWG